MNHRLSEEAKLQNFQSHLRLETIEFNQSLTISTETILNDVLTKFREEFTTVDLKEVARHKWDRSKHDTTAETFSDFLKRLKVTAKEVFQHNAV